MEGFLEKIPRFPFGTRILVEYNNNREYLGSLWVMPSVFLYGEKTLHCWYCCLLYTSGIRPV